MCHLTLETLLRTSWCYSLRLYIQHKLPSFNPLPPLKFIAFWTAPAPVTYFSAGFQNLCLKPLFFSASFCHPNLLTVLFTSVRVGLSYFAISIHFFTIATFLDTLSKSYFLCSFVVYLYVSYFCTDAQIQSAWCMSIYTSELKPSEV